MKLTKRKIVISMIFASVGILLLSVWRIGHELWYKEDYCLRIAKEHVGDEWGKTINANDYEKSQYPQLVQENGKIAIGMHTVLECGRNYKFLNIL